MPEPWVRYGLPLSDQVLLTIGRSVCAADHRPECVCSLPAEDLLET